MPAGYSGTPLAKKLGIKSGHRVTVVNDPGGFRELLVDLPEEVTFDTELEADPDVVIAFFTDATALRAMLEPLGESVFPDRTIWLAWPKKTAKVATDLTGDVVRSAVLETSLVDVKVCAISEIWSGLKVVWRKEHR